MIRLEVAIVMPNSSGLEHRRLFNVITDDKAPLIEGDHYVYFYDNRWVCQRWKNSFMYDGHKERRRVIHIIKQ